MKIRDVICRIRLGKVNRGLETFDVGHGALLEPAELGDPVEEARVGYEILKSLELVNRGVTIISCPTCGRTKIDVAGVANEIEARTRNIKQPLTIAIMGCEVNGPGEAMMTDIGFSGGGKGTHQVYLDGKVAHRLQNADIVEHLVGLVEKKAAEIEAEKKTLEQAAE